MNYKKKLIIIIGLVFLFSSAKLCAIQNPIISEASNKYSISGISSGAFMAIQMGLIFSKNISGIASIAGGYYFCAQNHMQEKLNQASNINLNYLSLFQSELNSDYSFVENPKNIIQASSQNPIYQSQMCMQKPEKTNLSKELILENEKLGLIDPVSNVQNQKILIYNGTHDTIVSDSMIVKNIEYYNYLNIPLEQIKIINTPGGHNFPTDKESQKPCAHQSVPYISSCQLNLAGEILQQVTPLKDLIRNINQTENINFIYTISQKLETQTKEVKSSTIASYGYMASNNFCLENPLECHVHVALHGCEMSDSFDAQFDLEYQKYAARGYLLMRNKSESIPFSPLPMIEQKVNKYGLLRFVLDSGYLDYVKNNNLIILFPQTWITEQNYPLNPKGCWDWYGWVNGKYATNQGSETSWLNQWINSVNSAPKSFIINESLKINEALSL